MNRRPHTGRCRNSGITLSAITEDEVDDIYVGALEVLERAGVKVEDSEVLDIFADAGCKVDRETQRVRIPPEVVEDAIRLCPRRVKFCGRDPRHDLIWETGRSTFTNFMEGIQVTDLETGAIRPSTKTDVGDMARITEFLPEMDLTAVSVGARDVPPETASIHNMDATLRNTTKGIMISLMSKHETEAAVEMAAAVVGGRDELAERPILAVAGGNVSPLFFNKGFTDYIIVGARAHIPTFALPMGLVGATAPVTIAGAVVLGTAEQFAGLVLIQACEPGCPTVSGLSTCGFDMRTGLASVGGPEQPLCMAAVAQVGRRTGIPTWAAGL